MALVTWYCPACGEESVQEHELYISPGSIDFRCGLCGTEFEVLVEFKEITDATNVGDTEKYTATCGTSEEEM